ncbi:MAG: vWA domain-containing protein [Acidimicrobiales bacterium]
MSTRPITSDQQGELSAWITRALELMPYMASVLLSLRPLDVPGLGTFACDRYYRLYVDFDAVVSLGFDHCAQALLHECCHLFAHDAERADEYGATTKQALASWNLAADAANNDDLVDAGCNFIAAHGFLPLTMGAENYLTAEQYMDLLYNDNASQGGGTDNDSEDADKSSQDSDSGKSDEPYAGCGSGSGGEPAPGELSADDSAGGTAPAATSVEKRIIDIATATEIKAAAARGIGAVPGGLMERATQVLAPSKLPWRQILSSSIRRSIASRAGDVDVTYSRRNRRRPYIYLPSGGRIVRPGSYSPIPSLVVVRDTSGSMGESELEMVSVEIEGIAKQLGIRDENFIVLDVDTEVQAQHKYRHFSQLQDIFGRGGTDMPGFRSS